MSKYGYYPAAMTESVLSTAQKARYEELRGTRRDQLHLVLQGRLVAIKSFVGPVTSGEIWAASEELIQDAFAAWVLGSENPIEVQWVTLEAPAVY